MPINTLDQLFSIFLAMATPLKIGKKTVFSQPSYNTIRKSICDCIVNETKSFRHKINFLF